MMWFVLLVYTAFVYAFDVNQLKNEALDYANQGSSIGQNAKSRAENIICTRGGADCSYQGQDPKNFSQESQARQGYLNQANDPNSALGRALSTIWSTSDIKSTLYYQRATELYRCAQVSPDGKCQKYVGESYYGDCQTVQECVSQTSQQTYAEYMCYIDAQGQITAGETKHLCYVYNRIEPTVKEKEYVCHVVNTESIKTCNKDLRLNFGACVSGNASSQLLFGGGVGNSHLTSMRMYTDTDRIMIEDSINGTYVWLSDNRNDNVQVRFGPLNIDLSSLTWPLITRVVGNGDSLTLEVTYCTDPQFLYCGGYATKNYTVTVSGVTIAGACEEVNPGGFAGGIYLENDPNDISKLNCYWTDFYQAKSDCVKKTYGAITYYICPAGTLTVGGFKCSLTNQTYASKSECYQNCYTQQVQDCQVQ